MEKEKERNETKEKAEKKKELADPEIKIALLAVGLLLVSVACVYLVAYSNQIKESDTIIGVIAGGIGGVIFGVIAGGIGGGIAGGIAGGIGGGIIGGIVGVSTDVIVGVIGGVIGGVIVGGTVSVISGEEIKIGISPWVIPLLAFILVFPFVILVIPLSRYHNQNQLKKDKEIAEVLKITKEEDGIEILLPNDYHQENDYLKKVLSVGLKGIEVKSGEEVLTKWQAITVPCREGKRYWHKAKLLFPKGRTIPSGLEIVFFFNHAWEDYQFSKSIPQ